MSPFQALKATMTPKAVPAAQAWVRNAGMKGDGVNNLLFKISMKT